MPSLTIRHLTTYRYRRAVAFGEHRMMLHPRDSHHQRVVQAELKISPKPKSLRFVQDAFGNHVGIARFSRRSKELSFESIVRLEHSPREIPSVWKTPDGPSPSAIASLSCATSPLISNAISTI
jgi:transglutaminase-like putative cysteine protease